MSALSTKWRSRFRARFFCVTLVGLFSAPLSTMGIDPSAKAGSDAVAVKPVDLRDGDAVLDYFQDLVKKSVLEGMGEGWRRDFVSRTSGDREHLHARKTTVEACFRRVDGTLSAKERELLLIHGKIEDLRDRKGACWEIMSFGGFGNGLEGYIDAETGALLLLWIVPEG